MFSINKLRYFLSILLIEVPNYVWQLKQNNNEWLYISNRKQKFIPAINYSGLCFLEEYTSQLKAAKLFPKLSNKLFSKTLQNYNFRFKSKQKKCDIPKVSYIIGHRGRDKIAHLNLVIQSIAGQSFDAIECIVVEQSDKPEVCYELPDWVSYYHLKIQDSDLYNRPLSFNYGARKAKGDYLVLHDNDLLIPACYTDYHVSLLEEGFDLVNLKRFIFGLTKLDTEKVFKSEKTDADLIPEYILQNAKGGGSLVISKQAYNRIGGFDERFKGWGGEDNELWQRAQVLNIYPFANLPLIHLWHFPQIDKRGGKHGRGFHTERLFGELSDVSIYNRIKFLNSINS